MTSSSLLPIKIKQILSYGRIPTQKSRPQKPISYPKTSPKQEKSGSNKLMPPASKNSKYAS